jgi:predicted transcriptional regulator
MTIAQILKVLDANVICCDHHLLETEIYKACGSDMMSDVLAIVKDQAVLLTGLLNPQVVRTAEMMDMQCIVFVRDKNPTEAIVELAKEKDICILKTRHTMFTACGLLYESGLRGGDNANV